MGSAVASAPRADQRVVCREIRSNLSPPKDCSGASTRFLVSRKVAPPPPHPSLVFDARGPSRGVAKSAAVSAVCHASRDAADATRRTRRGGRDASSCRIGASAPPPGWNRARSTRVSRVPSAVVEATAPRSRRVPRGKRRDRREKHENGKKTLTVEPSCARPVVRASRRRARSVIFHSPPCVWDAVRRVRWSVSRVGERREVETRDKNAANRQKTKTATSLLLAAPPLRRRRPRANILTHRLYHPPQPRSRPRIALQPGVHPPGRDPHRLRATWERPASPHDASTD